MPASPTPAISETTAFLCEALFTVFFIAPFYLSATLRHTPLNSRNAPSVIRARTRAVGLVCVASTLITVCVLTIYGHATPPEVLRLLGIWPVDLVDVAKVLGLVLILFSCSLYETIIVDSDWRGWSLPALKEGIWDSWIGYRNLFVAPLGEELVFRALTIPLFLLAHSRPTRIVFLTPLVFGGAHLHHLVEYLQSRTPQGQRWPPLTVWLNGIAVSLFQFTYTSLFGFFAAFVFLRTGNLWAVVAAHSFCNRMGVPRVWGRVGQFEEWQYLAAPMKTSANGRGQSKRSDEDAPGSPVKVRNSLMQDEAEDPTRTPVKTMREGPKNLGVAWTVVYYASIPVGVFGFYRLLWPLTESGKALATF